jgi:FKBP-type peptidyl-prolyl cis-trans isomerase FklB
MMCTTRASFLTLAAVLCFSLPVIAEPSQAAVHSATTSALTGMHLSFKRDPRMIDPYRGIGPWVTDSNYNGATAQDTVEVRAEGVDASGKPAKISPDWTASDSEMVTISPGQGDNVKVTVHKAGESKLKVTYQGLSKELVVRAKYVGKFMLFEIAMPTAVKPNGPAAMEINPVLKDQKAQISYAAGMRLANTLRKQSVEADPELVMQGMKDVISGGATLMNDTQVQTALMGVETELNVTEATLERKKIAEQNKQAGEQFLAENKKKDGVVTLPSGLQYKVMKAGDGKKPTVLDAAVCHYKGSLIDGTEFDNSYKKKDGAPVTFPVKAVIKGWQEALRLMPAGSRWQIVVPPDLAYGERGVPMAKIPPNATLVFEVELLSVKEPGQKNSQVATSTNTELTPEQIDAVKKAIQAAGRKEAETESEKNQ